MKIVYIHGANATSTSFNYIREHIDCPGITLNYSSSNPFQENLDEMIHTVSRSKGPVFFVAHSLGGVYALHIAQTIIDRTAGAVTLSTPYGGCREAELVRLFVPWSQLMRDIGPSSRPMSLLPKLNVPANWTNIVTTQGNNPFLSTANDGIVTVESMRALSNQMNLVELDLNHYEVVLSPKVLNIIQSKIKKSQKF